MSDEEPEQLSKQKPSSLGSNDSSGCGCPLQKYVFLFGVLVIGVYVAYLYDESSFRKFSSQYSILKPLEILFDNLDNYSPFQENVYSNDETSKLGQRQFSASELSTFDGKEGSNGIYIALLGRVFDVSKAPKYYGPTGSYSFFAGRDASRAFVTGKFDEQGLIDDIEGLSHEDYLGIDEWLDFYATDYVEVGIVVGRFYAESGDQTAAKRSFDQHLRLAKADRDQDDSEKVTFPVCNSEWSEGTGTRVWCTSKTGGKERNWVGVPRRLFFPGRQERCTCIRDTGPSSDNSGGDVGDLNSPHIKEYNDCDSKSVSCKMAK